MAKEQGRGPVLGLVYQYMIADNKLRLADVAKVKYKVVQKYLLQLNQLTLKDILYCLYIHNNDKDSKRDILVLMPSQS